MSDSVQEAVHVRRPSRGMTHSDFFASVLLTQRFECCLTSTSTNGGTHNRQNGAPHFLQLELIGPARDFHSGHLRGIRVCVCVLVRVAGVATSLTHSCVASHLSLDLVPEEDVIPRPSLQHDGLGGPYSSALGSVPPARAAPHDGLDLSSSVVSASAVHIAQHSLGVLDRQVALSARRGNGGVRQLIPRQQCNESRGRLRTHTHCTCTYPHVSLHFGGTLLALEQLARRVHNVAMHKVLEALWATAPPSPPPSKG